MSINGKSNTLIPGSPAMLTEYGEPGMLVINTATAGRVWLSGDSSVSPASGVPLEAGTSITWSDRGQIWAWLDPTTSAVGVVVVVSSSITSWSPSPVAVGVAVALQVQASNLANAIGGQVATQTNALGIPGTYISTRVFSGSILPGQSTGPIALSNYASIVVTVSTSATLARNLYLQQFGAGAIVSIESLTVPIDTSGAFGAAASWEIPLHGDSIQINNQDLANPVTVSVMASNRPSPRFRPVNRTMQPRYFAYTGALTAGTPVQLTGAEPASAGFRSNFTSLAGPVSLITSTPSAGTAGYIIARYIDIGGNTRDMYVSAVPAGNRSTFEFQHPATFVEWFYYPNVTVAASLLYELYVSPSG